MSRLDLRAARLRTLERIDAVVRKPNFAEQNDKIRAAAHIDCDEQRSSGGQRLAFLLEHALACVPKYQRLSEKRPERGFRISDFPITNRSDLSKNMGLHISRRLPNCELVSPQVFVKTSSGSTGEPVTHLKGIGDEGFWEAVFRERFRLFIKAPERGEQLDLGLRVAGQPLIEGRMLPGAVLSWNMRSFRHQRSGYAEEYLDILSEAQPNTIFGTPTKISELAHLCIEKNINLSPIAVITAYEPTNMGKRDTIERAFSAHHTELYGASETGTIAYRCAAGRFHYYPDIHHVEILDTDGAPAKPGQVGYLVVTALHSKVMPLIRYQTGDFARVPEAVDCACGTKSPNFAEVEGRSTDNYISQSGVWFAPYALINYLGRTGLSSFQILHEKPGQLKVIHDNAEGLPESDMAEFCRVAEGIFQEPVEVELDNNGCFHETKNGKRNPFVKVF